MGSTFLDFFFLPKNSAAQSGAGPDCRRVESRAGLRASSHPRFKKADELRQIQQLQHVGQQKRRRPPTARDPAAAEGEGEGDEGPAPKKVALADYVAKVCPPRHTPLAGFTLHLFSCLPSPAFPIRNTKAKSSNYFPSLSYPLA